MKSTKSKSLVRQAALITALILGSSGWVSAQTNQWRTTPGQYTPGQSTGQYQPGRSTGLTNQGQYNQGQYNQGLNTVKTNLGEYNQGQFNEGQPGNPGTQMDRQAGALNAYGRTNSQGLQVTEINKGSGLIGATVKNQQGEQLGEVKDLVIDFNSGRVSYLVLETDAGAFRSEKLHAIPLRAFQPDSTGTSLILNADKTKIEASAGFDKDRWPSAAAGVWGAEPSWNDGTQTTPNWPERKMDKWNTGNETNKTGKGSYDTNTNRMNKGTR